MTRKKRPLPKPPSSAFGHRTRFEEPEGGHALMADEMAAAMAEGKIEEFLQREMPDNEHARSLAMMMMGMSGMLPPQGLPPSAGEGAGEVPGDVRSEGATEKPSAAVQPPEDVLTAIHSGDVRGLMDILEREHKKRNPDAADMSTAEERMDNSGGLSKGEREVLDKLIEIASANNLALDWIVMRALKLYAREYEETGRL